MPSPVGDMWAIGGFDVREILDPGCNTKEGDSYELAVRWCESQFLEWL